MDLQCEPSIVHRPKPVFLKSAEAESMVCSVSIALCIAECNTIGVCSVISNDQRSLSKPL